MRSPVTTPWHPAGWQARPAQQQPKYKNPAHLEQVVAQLSKLPPIVVSWEIDALTERLAAAQRGQAFLLQGGDCAETFAECESDLIAKKLKILLQMSLVLLHGLKKPIIRVGRMAGQYAKPRSADMETKNGVTLPSFRGDLVNRPEFTAEAREPDPKLLLRGYERAALTLNFVRALVDGGFADLHHPEYWDLGFVNHSPLKTTYERIAGNIADALDFFEGISGTPRARIDARGFLREPRRPAPAVRAGADALHSAPAALVQPVDALSVDRHAHGAARRRARRIHARHLEPDRRKDRRRDGCRVAAGSRHHAESAEPARAVSRSSTASARRTSRSACRA